MMQTAALSRLSRPTAYRVLHLTPRQPFSTTLRGRGIFSSDRDDSLDPAKEDTDSIDKAKDSGGSNPAAQHASVSGHQNPKDASGNSSQGEGQQTSSSNPGLGSKHAKQGEKPGEEAVNPAVKGS